MRNGVHVDESLRPTAARSALVRLLSEDGGQDLIEYALLAAFIGIAGMLVLQAMSGTISATYSSWIDPAGGTPGLWIPPEPP